VFRQRSFLRELLEMAVLTIAIFLIVRVALQNFKVEGSSMWPTLHNNEYILVNKIDYMIHSPHRGDIIVFHAVPAGQPDRDFIKRVVGLPGETVAVHNGSVFINGQSLHENYNHVRPDYNFPTTCSANSYTQGSWCSERVPSGDYFVLGDNRNNSEDSHAWIATPWLARNEIIGKAWVSYWPFSSLHVFQAATLFHLSF
jgi:signal peptidase I